MREDHLDWLILMKLQISLEKIHLGGRNLFGPAGVEDCEMDLIAIEAVVRRMAGVVSKELFGWTGPDVVISGGEEQGEFLENTLDLAPFRIGGRVIQALDGVSDAHDEGRILGGGFLPDLFVNARLRFAGAVAQDYEGGSGEEKVEAHSSF